MGAWLAALCVAGCTAGPDFRAPRPFAPAGWNRPGATTDAPDPRWWRSFDDPVLTGLMERLAAGNLDLAAATARLGQVRALRTAAGGAQSPTLDAGAGYDRARLSRTGLLDLLPGTVTDRARRPFDLFEAGFDASWELDLWGRVRRGVESADAAVDAGTEERRAVLVSAEAELARSYIALRRDQRVRDATAGLAAPVPGAGPLARAEAALVAARLPGLRASVALHEDAIALLLGAPPGALATLLDTPAPVPPVPARLPAGLPSALLERRPDVRAAIARLHEATADIGVAEAEFFPRIALGGAVGVSALQPRSLGSLGAVTWSLGPSLTVPLFEGGRLKGQLELRRARQQEAAIAFQATVLRAFHEVSGALTACAAEAERRTLLTEAVAQARQAVAARGGADARRMMLEAETALADSTAALATDVVQLFKALGGGWETELPLPSAPG